MNENGEGTTSTSQEDVLLSHTTCFNQPFSTARTSTDQLTSHKMGDHTERKHATHESKSTLSTPGTHLLTKLVTDNLKVPCKVFFANKHNCVYIQQNKSCKHETFAKTYFLPRPKLLKSRHSQKMITRQSGFSVVATALTADHFYCIL